MSIKKLLIKVLESNSPWSLDHGGSSLILAFISKRQTPKHNKVGISRIHPMYVLGFMDLSSKLP